MNVLHQELGKKGRQRKTLGQAALNQFTKLNANPWYKKQSEGTMERILLFALGLFLTANAMAWVKCEDIVNKYGVYTQTCQNMPGPEPESNYYHGSTVNKGDIKRVTKSSDGSISVKRYGHEGDREEYRETSPGTWERR